MYYKFTSILKSKIFNMDINNKNIKKFKKFKYGSFLFLLFTIILLWSIVSYFNIVPRFMLPSPLDIIKAFKSDFYLLISNSMITVCEAIIGLIISIILSFIIAYLMDRFINIYKSFYPLLVISQTIPTIVIAPILVLWFGYGLISKIVLIVICCFFPIVVALTDGFKSCDVDNINLMKSMGASKSQIFYYVKLPLSMDNFFSGLKISISYSIVSAVVAEWLGGSKGLGVYITKVKKSYMFDKMFAAVILISIISVLLVQFVKIIQNHVMSWKFINTYEN